MQVFSGWQWRALLALESVYGPVVALLTWAGAALGAGAAQVVVGGMEVAVAGPSECALPA